MNDTIPHTGLNLPTSIPRPAFGDPEEHPDQIFLDLDEEGLAAQADVAWIHDQFNLGVFEGYRGEYVAVVNKKLLGHNKSLKALREEVSRATGHSINRIVTSFIERRGY